MTALLAFSGVVIDVGRLYVEKRELQNGADAAVMAVGTGCIQTSCTTALAQATSLVNQNAKDGQSSVVFCGTAPGLTACASTPAGVRAGSKYVNAKVTTVDPTNSADQTKKRLLMAPLIPGAPSGVTVHAQATAAYGGLGSIKTLAIIVSECEFLRAGGVIGEGPISNATTQLLFREQATPCMRDGGVSLSGGFGWSGGATQCERTIEVPFTLPERPGNALDNDCSLTPYIGKTVVLSVFNATNGLGGSNGQYYVTGFVAFTIEGWSFPGSTYPARTQCSSGPQYSCLVGRFTTTLMPTGSIGGTDYGARVVEIVG